MIETFPLTWPQGWKRTSYRRSSKFAVSSVGSAAQRIIKEMKLLGGSKVVISTNLELRRDGLPYANQAQPEDGGVAVYFVYRDKQMCFACDTYKKIQENLVAIAKTIEALRGMERWGASDMMERAFRGFAALPASTGREWWAVLKLPVNATRESIERSFRELAKSRHPDNGGSHDLMSELNAARSQALKEAPHAD